MGNTVDKDLGWKKILQQAEVAAKDPHVKIGIQTIDGQKPKTVRGGTFSGGHLIDIAVIHEFGSKSGHIPERSYLRATHDMKIRERVRIAASLLGKVMKGQTTISKALDVMGVKGQSDVKMRIAAGIKPPNTEATIRRKGSSKPLVDTGQLEESIQYMKVMNGVLG